MPAMMAKGDEDALKGVRVATARRRVARACKPSFMRRTARSPMLASRLAVFPANDQFP